MLSQGDRLAGGVGAGPGDHGHTAGGLLNGHFHHAVVLLVTEGRRLPRRPARDNAVYASLNLEVDEPPEAGLVELAVPEGCDDGSEAALKHDDNPPLEQKVGNGLPPD